MSSYSLKTAAVLALTSSFLSPVLAQANPSCVDNASEGTTFQGFEISCGVDYYGGDLSNSWLPSFAACIDDCDKTEGCVDVSFVGDDNGGQCYRKSSVGALTEKADVWTAKKAGVSAPVVNPGLVCPADDGKSYTAANGKKYKVICGQEYYGGDLAYANVATFDQCLEACSSTTGCIDVSYVSGNCYMKDTISDIITAENVWTGKFYVPAVVLQPASTRSSTTTTTVSSTTSESPSPTTTSAVTIPTPEPQGPLSCEAGASNGIEFTTPANNVYEIACGIDYYGGDIPGGDIETESFEGCLTACDTTSGCIDVAFVPPKNCYLKDTLTEAVPVGHVWGAKFLRAIVDTSSSTSSSSSSTTSEASSSATTSEASSSTTTTTSETTTTTSSSTTTTTEASSTTTTRSSTTTRASPTTMMRCNRDNCLRDMVATKIAAAASAFCSTYTTAVVTDVAAIPTYLAGCQALSSRVSSACSCVVTPAPTPF